MAKIVIGGKEHRVEGELPFRALKKAWPQIKRLQADNKLAQETGELPDPVEAMERSIAIVAAALNMEAEEVESVISAKECQNLDQFIVEIMRESGFIQAGAAAPGEPQGDEVPGDPSSMETSTESLPSSSPEDAAAGTTS